MGLQFTPMLPDIKTLLHAGHQDTMTEGGWVGGGILNCETEEKPFCLTNSMLEFHSWTSLLSSSFNSSLNAWSTGQEKRQEGGQSSSTSEVREI